jgi:signal transduction histidine kinase
MELVDPAVIIRDAAELYEPLAEERGLKLIVDAPEGLQVRGNRELLSQAMANLIDNAIKHGPPEQDMPESEGVEPTIAISASQDASGRILLSVADHGAGIPTHERGHVLERFVRLEASRNTPGSGLGLSLVAAAARLHGGRIELEDNHPGLKAIISLPAPAR